MTEIRLELRGGEPIGTAHIAADGGLTVKSQNSLMRPRLTREIQALIALGPFMERFGCTEKLPDGRERQITKGRICSPGERAYLDALAERIRRNKIQLGDGRLLAWVVDETADA